MKKYLVALALVGLIISTPLATQAFSGGDLSSLITKIENLITQLKQFQLGAVGTITGESAILSDFVFTPSSPLAINTTITGKVKITNNGTVALPGAGYGLRATNVTDSKFLFSVFVPTIQPGASVVLQNGMTFSFPTAGYKDTLWELIKVGSTVPLTTTHQYLVAGESAGLLFDSFSLASPVAPNTNVTASIKVVSNGTALSGYQLVGTSDTGLVIPTITDVSVPSASPAGIQIKTFTTPPFNSGTSGNSVITWKLIKGTTVLGNAVTGTLMVGQATPSIAVISPNGGENWKVGETHNITWKTKDLPSSDIININLLQKNNAMLFVANAINSGSYSWTIPVEMHGFNLNEDDNYKIQLLDNKAQPSYFSDLSDTYFSILESPTTPTVNSITPNTAPIGTTSRIIIRGLNFSIGSTIYTFNGETKDKLFCTISVNANGNYDCPLPATFSAGAYKLAVVNSRGTSNKVDFTFTSIPVITNLTVASTSAILGQGIGSPVDRYPVTFSFTLVNSGDIPLYLSNNPSIAFATVTSPVNSPSSVSSFLASLLPGDSPGAYVIPANGQRRFVASGLIMSSLQGAGLQIVSIFYGTSASDLRALNIDVSRKGLGQMVLN